MYKKDDYLPDMGSSDLITKSNPRIATYFASIDRMLEGMEQIVKNCKPALNGERYLTDKEVSERLNVSRRTLLEYRNGGRISYCLLGGKIIYRESDIEKMLESNYRKAYK